MHPGQTVTFTVDAIPNRTFTGRLTQIRDPYTPSDKQQQSGAQQSTLATFDAVIEVDNPDLLLRPSLTANVSVIVNRRPQVLTVPNSALRVEPPRNAVPVATPPPAPSKDGGATATVYRLPGGDRAARPEAVRVRLGITDSIVTEVLEGLNEGDMVITGKPAELPDRFGRGVMF